ncbi:Site-specific recombinase XerD [Butyrivibrio proteoclasticus]|uniref:Site-specific recombinase XerD n=1 Tax=Butyrivibrio proteoclasticus TaxID=43305 RepID=A0A1I5YB44_9FIRM|nr:site-specific integrase [Butyrivibrio proteoclasticus]SFQ41444.1 Site-specific recombinase XerD [Butyrivibrio proteoclasticus]
MARPKKSGKRATGIQGRSGYLYIIKNNYIIKDGSKTFEKQWISTGLKDTPENIKKASEMRSRLLNKKEVKSTDRNISLSKYADGFLEKKKREVSDTTLSSYFYRTNRIKNYFGDTKVKDVNETMVENFLDDMFTAYHVQYRTVKDTKVLLSSILEQAIKEGLIASNPAKEVVINKNLANRYAKEKDTDEEFFSYEEAQHFLDVIKDHELYELFYVTLFFGLRREELLGLRWSALDFKNKTMSINHTVTRGTVINRVNSTKTDSSAREYPLTDEQIAMFKRLKEKETEYRQLFGNNYHESDYIFKHVDGSLFYPDYPSKLFCKLIKKIPELPQDITFHGLRSSCVSILVHQNKDVKSIQKWVGHADINTTLKIYAKVKDKEAKREISDTMTGIIPLKDYSEHDNDQ